MKTEINQFIWGYQQQFRWSVGYELNKILSQIGLETNGKARVMLVAFAVKDDLPHAICIEPEDGPLVLEDFAETNRRTLEILASDPESGRVYYPPYRFHEYRTRQLFLRSRAHAISRKPFRNQANLKASNFL